MSGYLATKIITSPILLRVVGATPVPLGPTVGTAVVHHPGAGHSSASFVWDGVLYKAAADGIWRSIDDGATFVQVKAFAAQTSGVWGAPFAMFIVFAGGIPRLVCLYIDVSGVLHYVVSLTGIFGSWTDTNSGVTCFSINYAFVYRGIIAFNATTAGSATFVDPVAGSVSQITTTNAVGTYIYAWGDILYMSGRFSGAQFQLRSLAGGVSTNLLNIAAFDQTGWRCAFVDPATGNIIQIVLDTTSLIVKAFEITPVLGVTDRTATMITGGSIATLNAADARLAGVIFDQDGTPGAAPVISVLVSAASAQGTTVSQFRFNGVLTKMGNGAFGTPNDSGGDIAHAYPDKGLGGERFFTPRSPGTDGSPQITGTGLGALGVGVTRRKFKLSAPRSQVLTTLVGAATYNLATNPLTATPIRSGFTTIRAVFGGIALTLIDSVTPGVISAQPTTTVAPASNGVPIICFGAGTLNVVSTTGFPASGTLLVQTTLGTATLTYAGLLATAFTGCTCAGLGTVLTGHVVVARDAFTAALGTIDYATGAMTGTTVTLDAASQVEALYVGGLAKHEWYRSQAESNPYPVNSVKAPLTLPTSGTIGTGGDVDRNINCLADGSEQQVSVGMSGFAPGDRVAINPRALP